jgi:hypothetical protein
VACSAGDVANNICVTMNEAIYSVAQIAVIIQSFLEGSEKPFQDSFVSNDDVCFPRPPEVDEMAKFSLLLFLVVATRFSSTRFSSTRFDRGILF